MEFEEGKKAIARIYSVGDVVSGVGFLVSDRYVLTCAHVVQASIASTIGANLIGETVTVALPFSTEEEKYLAQVVFYDLDTIANGNDFAILRLITIPKAVIQSIQLKPLTVTEFVELRVFGFPQGDEAGRNLTAVTRGRVAGEWEQIEDTKQPGLGIEEGFSGAPVWCQALKAFIGMVVARDQKRPEAKLGFMIPRQNLGKPLQFVLQQTLCDLLEPEQSALSKQITIAYQVCRPVDLPKPAQTQLKQRLEDLSCMSQGDLKEPMLVQFAACLLNQELSASIRQELDIWAKRHTDNLESLRNRLRDKETAKQTVIRSDRSLSMQQVQPCLLVSVKSHEAKDKYCYVSAWLIRDFDGYDSMTGRGAEPVVPQKRGNYADAENLNPEEGIPCNKIPVLLADYLDQVGSLGIDLQHLTVELLLPLSLMNEPIEQRLIPAKFGPSQPLVKDCRVVVRSQERLEGYRSLGRWQTKWKQLEKLLETNAGKVFVPGTENNKQLQKQLSSDDVLGLRLNRTPSTDTQGELGVLLSTGAPIALWVRKEDPAVNWEELLGQQVFCCLEPGSPVGSGEQAGVGCCLESRNLSSVVDPGSCCRSIKLAGLPQKVSSVRQNAPDLDEDSELEQSLELGHHLSFLWEDPKRVPPKITY